LAKFTQDLKNGWNPEQPEVKRKSILTVIEAFNLALSIKKNFYKMILS
jgi:hypothetical protein